MITAPLAAIDRYVPLHPRFAGAVEFIRHADLAALGPGRHPVDGEALVLIINQEDGRGREGARLEAHRKYIDIQVTLAGDEEIGWRPLESCTAPTEPFNTERDIVFFTDHPDVWLKVPAQSFAIFFPEDAHAPLGGRGALRKAVLKVRVQD